MKLQPQMHDAVLPVAPAVMRRTVKRFIVHLPDAFFCLIFLTLLALPGIVFWRGAQPATVPIEENRAFATKPDLRHAPLGTWPKLLAPYFYDQMPFRTQCVAAYMYLWERGLHVPVKDRIVGRGGERFIAVADYLGLCPIAQSEQLMMRLAIAGTNAWFAAHNIPYLFVTLPDKATYYHARLPFWTTWKKGESRYDQFARCAKASGADVLDLLPVLHRHADGRRLYDRNQDLYHWNGNALSIAYQAIADYLRTKNVDFNPQTLTTDYSIVPFTTRLDSPFYNAAYGRQQTVYIRLADPSRLNNKTDDDMPAMPSSAAEVWKNPILLENPGGPAGNLWLLCDSYFMATHCEETPRWVGCALPEAFQVRTFFRTHYELFTPASALKLLRTFPPGAVVEAMTQWVGTGGLLKRAKDPLIRILGDLALHTPGDVLDPTYPWETVRADHARLTVEPTTVLADCDTGASLRFPAKRTDGDGRLAVMAALDAPADGAITLRCAPLGQPPDAAPATTIALRKGLNLIHLPVIDKPFQWMAVRLELPAGTWRFQPIPTDFSNDRAPLGADIPFTAANPLTVAMSGTGWHSPEPAGTWTSGPKATLLLPTFLKKGQGAEVTFHFVMLALPGAHNRLRLSSGGSVLWEAVIPDTQQSAHPKVFFPPELVDKGGNLPVQIESAATIHMALDSRRLGVILTSLRIDPVEQQPLPPGK